MPLYGDSLTLQEVRDGDSGPRPSYKALLSLIDTSDPAWPMTAAILQEMTEAGVDVDESAFGIAAKVARHRLRSLDAGKTRNRRPEYELLSLAAADSGSIVYYVRRGEVIKIGTTTVPVMRFETLMPDEILAFEPGTAKQEKIRHRQFAHLRCRGEHFRIAPELLEHARHLRQMYGDPDPAWPTVASLRKKRSAGADLPAPVSGEKVTVVEAAARLGIKRDRVYGWAHRRLISPAGLNDRGVRVFYLEHVRAIRNRTA